MNLLRLIRRYFTPPPYSDENARQAIRDAFWNAGFGIVTASFILGTLQVIPEDPTLRMLGYGLAGFLLTASASLVYVGFRLRYLYREIIRLRAEGEAE